MQKCQVQFSELDRLPYYEYQWLLDDVLELIKAEEEQRSKESTSTSKQQKSMQAQQQRYMQNATSMMPKMPTELPMPKFNNNLTLPHF